MDTGQHGDGERYQPVQDSAATLGEPAEPDSTSVSFEAWAAARHPALVRLAYLITTDLPRAEAATQQSLVATYARRRRLPTVDSREAYARRALLRHLLGHGPGREPGQGQASRSTPAGAPPGRDGPVGENGLSEAERAALVLRYYEELSLPHVSTVLGVSEPTARVRLSAALTKLTAIPARDAAEPAAAEESPAQATPAEPTAAAAPNEQTVAAALHAQAAAVAVRPVDLRLIRSEASRRRRRRGFAAASALALIAGAGAVVATLGGPGAKARHHLQTPAHLQASPTLSWRREYYRDIELRVPSGWAYADEPGTVGCSSTGVIPRTPYVARAVGQTAGCLSAGGNGSGTSLWVDHVVLTPRAGSARTTLRRAAPFWVLTKPVGAAVVKVVAGNRPLAYRIAGTAHVVGAAAPCPPTSPIQGPGFPRPDPPFDLQAIRAVTSLTICRYDRTVPPGRPGLISAYRMHHAGATIELRALEAAPPGGGPDSSSACRQADTKGSAIVLSLHSGTATHRLYVYYSGCRGNGFDDGTTFRTITTRACHPLVAQPFNVNPRLPAERRCLGL